MKLSEEKCLIKNEIQFVDMLIDSNALQALRQLDSTLKKGSGPGALSLCRETNRRVGIFIRE